MRERLIHFINIALNLFVYLSHEINYDCDEMGKKKKESCLNEYYQSYFPKQFIFQRWVGDFMNLNLLMQRRKMANDSSLGNSAENRCDILITKGCPFVLLKQPTEFKSPPHPRGVNTGETHPQWK